MISDFHKRRVGGLQVAELKGDPDRETIILLHGFGADALDLLSLSEVCRGPTWIFPQGPIAVSFSQHYTGYAWFPIDMELLSRAPLENRFDEVSKAFSSELIQARARVEGLIDALDTPRSKLILGGFSQGAILAVDTALHGNDSCMSLLIFSGALVNEKSWKSLAPLHKNTSFFQSHGLSDPLLPIQKARDLEHVLTQSGLEGKLHTFQGGHEIPHSILQKLTSFLNV